MADHEESRRAADKVLHARLDGIESELREMRQAIVLLARVEERMAGYAAADVRLESNVAALTVRLTAMEVANTQTKISTGMTERIWWIIFSVGLAAGVAWLSRGGM